ncbi:hypothetical protein AAG570_013644 [Ranatra chinensis]|uniref:Inorganic phosphate cotransporter n=1 Tax=Ranatra chinensis TaxID=642074 RepID=A0ABD0YZ47_9HEMI
MLGTGLIIGNDNRNWPWTFYIFGGLGVLWSIFYFLFTSSSPDGHKFLSEKEKEILDEYREGVVSETQWPPIKDIFKNAAVWAAIIASFGHDWGMFVLVIDLPKYTASILHLSIQMNGLILSCGYFLVFIVAIISGYPADILIEKKITGRTLNRIIFTTIASGGPAIGLLAAAYSGCNQVLVCACLLIGMASMGTFYVSLKVNLIDLSPKYAGFIGSVGNGIGTLAGVLVPIVNGFLTPNVSCLFYIEKYINCPVSDKLLILDLQ